jgi:hypothetical protein
MEVALDPADLVKLLSQNAYVLREDLTLMESGVLKCQSFGANVTREQAARLNENLSRLQEVIEAFGDNFRAPASIDANKAP